MRFFSSLRAIMVLAGSATAACRLASAQEALPPVGELLPKIYDYAERYRAALPSLSCDEAITSQEVKKGAVKKEVKIESTLREIRTGKGTSGFEEKHEFRLVNGAPAGSHASYPYFVNGGFANALGFVRRDQTNCYDYTVLRGDGGTVRLELVGRPERPGCNWVPEDYRKSVVAEPESGRVMHVERTISANAAKKLKEVYFASFDYGPQSIGDETMWLPTAMTSHDAKDEGRVRVAYSNYHRFAGSATLLPATAKEPE